MDKVNENELDRTAGGASLRGFNLVVCGGCNFKIGTFPTPEDAEAYKNSLLAKQYHCSYCQRMEWFVLSY